VWCREPVTWESTPQIPAADLAADEFDAGSGADEWNTDNALQERVFFDSDADHLFTLADYALLRGHVNPNVLKLAAREWIVTACERCNRGRRAQLTPARSLLSVYARHLLERSGTPDWDDLSDFVTAVRALRVRRARPATGTVG